MTIYEVREQQTNSNPQDRGRLVSQHLTFSEARKKAETLAEQGRNVFVSKTEE